VFFKNKRDQQMDWDTQKMLASDVMFARGRLSRFKAAGGLSSVVYEMLLELPYFLLQIISICS